MDIFKEIPQEEINKMVKGINQEYLKRSQKRENSILDKLMGINPDEEREVIEAIQVFSDKMLLATEFIKSYPLYYDEAGVWWVWNKNRYCWEMSDDISLLNLIRASTLSSLNIIKTTERLEILNALKQQARKYKPQEPGKTWLQFKDEIIDIETGLRFKPDPKYFLTSAIPWRLGKEEDTPTIDKLFIEWVGEKYKETLYEIFAFCLIKDYFLERIFCLVGSGSNGKSCYLNILRTFLGEENYVTTELNLLINSRFETAKLRGKLACVIAETDFNILENTQRIKRMVSGKDTIAIEYKGKGHYEYINYAKVLIATNNVPETTDKTTGFYRRWLIIDFFNQFTEKEDVLKKIPESEFENMALKCIGILMRLLEEREFTNEGSFEDRRKRYEDRSNPFDKFWKENIIEDFDGNVTSADFKKKLSGWCKENSFRELSDRTIAKHMKDKQIIQGMIWMDWWDNEHVTKKKARAWVGIKWKDIELESKKEIIEEVFEDGTKQETQISN